MVRARDAHEPPSPMTTGGEAAQTMTEPVPLGLARNVMRSVAEMASSAVLGALAGASAGANLGNKLAEAVPNPIALCGDAIGALGGMVVGGTAGLAKGIAATLG